jgi:hypothetical protein
MARVKQVLKDVSIEVAKRQRKCHHKKTHSISMGEQCIVVKDPSTGGKRNYCIECGNDILDVATSDLEHLRTDLNT